MVSMLLAALAGAGTVEACPARSALLPLPRSASWGEERLEPTLERATACGASSRIGSNEAAPPTTISGYDFLGNRTQFGIGVTPRRVFPASCSTSTPSS